MTLILLVLFLMGAVLEMKCPVHIDLGFQSYWLFYLGSLVDLCETPYDRFFIDL